MNAVDGRSYNQLNIDRAKYNSKKDADFMIDAAETRRCNDLYIFHLSTIYGCKYVFSLIANALFLNCLFVDELIHTS